MERKFEDDYTEGKNMDEPRVITSEEGTDLFLNHIHNMVKYWEDVDLSRNPPSGKSDTYDRLNGLAFSILTTIDGSSAALPAFTITPNPHPHDEAFCKQQGENWWDAHIEIGENVELHSRFVALGKVRT